MKLLLSYTKFNISTPKELEYQDYNNITSKLYPTKTSFARFVMANFGVLYYHATQPPSTAMVCPVTQFAASDAKNKTAPTTSSTSPTRPIGIRRTTSS